MRSRVVAPVRVSERTRLQTYSEAELSAFEARMGIALPAAYRSYLICTGGGEGTTSAISLLEEWCQPNSEEEMPRGFLAHPFPLSDAWNDVSLYSSGKRWQSAYCDVMFWRGSLRIVNVGCEAYYLLVVSGPEYGNVWCDDRVRGLNGIFPLRTSSGGRITIADYLTYGARRT